MFLILRIVPARDEKQKRKNSQGSRQQQQQRQKKSWNNDKLFIVSSRAWLFREKCLIYLFSSLIWIIFSCLCFPPSFSWLVLYNGTLRESTGLNYFNLFWKLCKKYHPQVSFFLFFFFFQDFHCSRTARTTKAKPGTSWSSTCERMLNVNVKGRRRRSNE